MENAPGAAAFGVSSFDGNVGPERALCRTLCFYVAHGRPRKDVPSVPARHFAALIQRRHPGVSIRQLTEAAGLAENKIAYYLKPSTVITRIPPAETVAELARALHCEPVEVVRAFAADVDLPWSDGAITDDERDLLRMTRQLAPREQRMIRVVIMAMLTALEAERCNVSEPRDPS